VGGTTPLLLLGEGVVRGTTVMAALGGAMVPPPPPPLLAAAAAAALLPGEEGDTSPSTVALLQWAWAAHTCEGHHPLLRR